MCFEINLILSILEVLLIVNQFKMKKILLVTALLFMSNAFATDDKDTFNQLKQLEGKWVGTINYSNRDANL